MRSESLKDFLSRGGKIHVAEAQPAEDVVFTMRVNSPPENRILSLEDGEFYFSENKKSSKPSIKLARLIEDSGLPNDVVERMRSACEKL
jgi:hypothetical protein